jgi:hypothetical protein
MLLLKCNNLINKIFAPGKNCFFYEQIIIKEWSLDLCWYIKQMKKKNDEIYYIYRCIKKIVRMAIFPINWFSW